MNNSPRVCVPRLLTDEQRADAVSVAIQENENNRQEIRGTDGRMLAVEVRKRWQNGRTIRCRFLNGDSIQRAKCEKFARKWEAYANIKFAFVDDADADIRIAFRDGHTYTDDGSWSYLGTDSLMVSKSEPTMYYGWLDKNEEDAEWERVVVHEFGHALGADHEDQQPAYTIKWDREAVYKYFTGPPNNWSREDVDSNILDPIDATGVMHSEFDELSIMAYAIPPEFTLDKKGVQGGNVLSERDKTFIAEAYPINQVQPDVLLVPSAPYVNVVIDANNPRTIFSMPVKIPGLYRVWTSLLKGIISINAPDGKQVRTGLQQVTFDAQPGEYKITMLPPVPNQTYSYRAITRRIS